MLSIFWHVDLILETLNLAKELFFTAPYKQN